MNKFIKFWGKYGWYFHLTSAVLMFFGGEPWLALTNLVVAVPLFIESKTQNDEQ
jgi:hypothetical protein